MALWALAGQSLKQQKYMAEQIGYNFIINMLLSSSAKMQYVGKSARVRRAAGGRRAASCPAPPLLRRRRGGHGSEQGQQDAPESDLRGQRHRAAGPPAEGAQDRGRHAAERHPGRGVHVHRWVARRGSLVSVRQEGQGREREGSSPGLRHQSLQHIHL